MNTGWLSICQNILSYRLLKDKNCSYLKRIVKRYKRRLNEYLTYICVLFNFNIFIKIQNNQLHCTLISVKMVLGTSISWFSFKIIISCTSCIFSLSQCGTTKNKRLGDQLLTCKSSAWNTREKGVESSLYPRKIGLYIDSQPKSRNSTTSLHCNPNHLRQTMLFENILKNIYIFKNCHAYATNNYQENYILASSRPVTCAKAKKLAYFEQINPYLYVEEV